MPSNRRKYTRISSLRVPCTVELDGNELDCVVVDESIDGMRIGGVELTSLSLNQKVTFQYKEETVIGRCRSVSRNDDGSFSIGVLRVDSSYSHQHRSFLLNTFMRSARLNIVCQVEERQSLGQRSDELTVRLTDGKTFVLNRSRVYCRTRDERRLELDSIVEEPEFSEIAKFYSLITSSEVAEEVDAILEQEFGSTP